MYSGQRCLKLSSSSTLAILEVARTTTRRTSNLIGLHSNFSLIQTPLTSIPSKKCFQLDRELQAIQLFDRIHRILFSKRNLTFMVCLLHNCNRAGSIIHHIVAYTAQYSPAKFIQRRIRKPTPSPNKKNRSTNCVSKIWIYYSNEPWMLQVHFWHHLLAQKLYEQNFPNHSIRN